MAGMDISLTDEPNPLLLDYLLPSSSFIHHGLALAGSCTLRPHYESANSAQFDLAVALLGDYLGTSGRTWSACPTRRLCYA